MSPLLSAEAFRLAAQEFAGAWAEWLPEEPPWTWVPAAGGLAADLGQGYLELRDVPRRTPGNSSGGAGAPGVQDAGGAADMEADGEAAGAAAAAGDGEVYLYCFSVVYSLAYRVPVLYFEGRTRGGAPLSMEDVLSAGHAGLAGEAPAAAVAAASGDPRALVSHEEHPLLGRPALMLHPCQTDAAMHLLLAPEPGSASGAASAQGAGEVRALSAPLRYLMAWYSLASQPLGLPRFPLQFWAAA